MLRHSIWFALAACLAVRLLAEAASDPLFPDPASLPAPGATSLRALTSEWLEARIVSGRKSFSGPMSHGAVLEGENLSVREPGADWFSVTVDGRTVPVAATGFRRYPIHAAYREFNLTEMNQIFIRLSEPAREGAVIRVSDLKGGLWDRPLEAELSPMRLSPAIHFNRLGYVPGFPKIAHVSFDLGSAGELELPEGTEARLLDDQGQEVFRARLERQRDEDWPWHQAVYRFDFSAFREPGTYRIAVGELGVSAPLRIFDGAFAAGARLHAIGMYHQRSGASIGPPFTRFAHAASHVRPAEIPTMDDRFKPANRNIGRMAEKNTDPEVQSAPRMDDVSKSLFPFVRQGAVDVSGGHFDAGDYSKYLINSSLLVHALVFAVDRFPRVAAIDNLGLPESGDGIPDALQIARLEAEFILKMQDADGGFSFLVYPRDRPYELDVLPENGDPQVLFPKTTASTAAAVGALAQMAASPAFKKFYPERAGVFLKAAKEGYAFLRKAIDTFGLKGSYQAISHYGTFAGHTDELCYAAAAMFAATGDKSFERDLMAWWPDPTGPESTRWGWWPLFEAYGSAARTYAFVEEGGALPLGSADAPYLARMKEAVIQAGEAVMKLQQGNSFGIPLSHSSKRRAQVGWYWAMDQAFDVIGAWLLTSDLSRRQELISALVAAAGFESGGSPSDRSYVSGSGPVWRREVVNRMSLNDDRVLAPPGISSGNVFSSPYNLDPYKIAGAAGLRKMFYPALDQFAFYDRAGTDAYNLRAECVTAVTARILAGYLFLMGQTQEAANPWVPAPLQIAGVPDDGRPGDPFLATLIAPSGLNPAEAQVIWEQPGQESVAGPEYHGSFPPRSGRLEVEAVWPDGRRLSGVRTLNVKR